MVEPADLAVVELVEGKEAPGLPTKRRLLAGHDGCANRAKSLDFTISRCVRLYSSTPGDLEAVGRAGPSGGGLMGPRGGLREAGMSITGIVIARTAVLAVGRASGGH